MSTTPRFGKNTGSHPHPFLPVNKANTLDILQYKDGSG
eukprot:CAMPEP_0184686388 /NCGR_PEP_ID=MMETSP0312-20130426/22262_1 /TAXON_ID=31354 /ORGANISM="Compsopogon coeruleus, Strain SAG 36.94" /LENGTH=37 /DNA_ID= /DNA_START= /DNA_END= /DNA_ORIENTATION=